jgi:hypothetical protein
MINSRKRIATPLAVWRAHEGRDVALDLVRVVRPG